MLDIRKAFCCPGHRRALPPAVCRWHNSSLSETQFPYLQTGQADPCLIRVILRIREACREPG